jgi:Fur family ferric uptake transcriptional regulator
MSTPPRQTRQRSAVKALLDDLDEFRSAQQVHESLRSEGASIGLTTVYRTLQSGPSPSPGLPGVRDHC